jgi:hypothetical protein
MSIPESMLTLIDTATETVKQSLKSFVENGFKCNPDMLSGALVSEVSCGLERSLDEAGRAAFKSFIEQFECGEERIERDGRTYRLKDEADSKSFLTVFGEVELTRRYYHCHHGGPGIVPLDESWDMQGKRYAMPEIVEKILWSSAEVTPGKLEEFCGKMCRFNPSAACIQDIIARDGAGMATMLETEKEGVECRGIEVPEGTEVIACSLDGANVLLREKGVKRGRKAQRPGLKDNKAGVSGLKVKGDDTETDPTGQSGTCYKNAMVGSFSFYRGEEGVVDIENGVEGIVPHRLGSIYCARMPEDKALGFKKEFEAIHKEINATLVTADGSGDGDNDGLIKILLIDGARPLWNYVENNPSFIGYHMLLDFFHATEHLSQLAAAIFGKNSKKAKEWYDKWRFKLKYEKNAVEGILRSAAYYGNTTRLPGSRRKDMERELVFFKRNKERMNYYEHVAKGWPIGSGPVEAACKTIVKQRLCRSGMRWKRDGGRNILALKVLCESDQWDKAWQKYCSERWLKQPKPLAEKPPKAA